VQRQLDYLPRSALDGLQDDALPLVLPSYRRPAGLYLGPGFQPGKQCRQPCGGAASGGFLRLLRPVGRDLQFNGPESRPDGGLVEGADLLAIDERR